MYITMVSMFYKHLRKIYQILTEWCQFKVFKWKHQKFKMVASPWQPQQNRAVCLFQQNTPETIGQ